MTGIAKGFKSIAIISLFFGLPAAVDANCDTPVSGCPPYSQASGAFPKNSNVQVHVIAARNRRGK